MLSFVVLMAFDRVPLLLIRWIPMEEIKKSDQQSHMLLVDDDRVILSTMSRGLERAGYRVSTAESHDEALAFLQCSVRPNLVILDVQMPQGDGLTLAERLRDIDQIPFIMLSAYSDPEIVDKATSIGALGYLVKPIEVSQMVPTIEAALVRASELNKLRTSSAQLQNALQEERDINVAVGIAMMQYRLTREAAFDLLRTSARAQRRKLAEVCRESVATASNLHRT